MVLAWALPRPEDVPNVLPRFDLGVDPEHIGHPLARDVIERLQALRRRVKATTPHDLLSQAIDVLRLPPILLQRHRGQAERALANVDLYLSLSRAYAVRGLRAFAETMATAWNDESRAVEGRPDAQTPRKKAVALYTMHAAKGLEWPIVVPVNTMTQLMAPESAVTNRANGHFYCPVFGLKPTGYEAVRDAEKAELDRERIRLWYVAATRARELLVLPRLDVAAKSSAWISLLDLGLVNLPALDLRHLPPDVGAAAATAENRQTRETYAADAAAIAARHRQIIWLAPSRHEGAAGPVLQAETPEILATDADGVLEEDVVPTAVQGGRERGLILHKLIEEVLTGETEEATPALNARAEILILASGRSIANDPALGLVPAELAGCVTRTLALPEVTSLRPGLTPEFPVYASTLTTMAELDRAHQEALRNKGLSLEDLRQRLDA